MLAQRYECQLGASGTWSVIDTFTGRVCAIGAHDVHRLRQGDVIEIVELLNIKSATPVTKH